MSVGPGRSYDGRRTRESSTRKSRGKPRAEKPYQFRVTSRGCLFALASLACTCTGAWYQNEVLTRLGILGVLAFLGSLAAAWMNKRGLRVQRKMPKSIFAQEEYTAEIQIHNGKFFPASYAIEVEDPMFEKDAHGVFARRVAARGSTGAAFRLSFPIRGVVQESPFTIRSIFPFGFFHFEETRLHKGSMVVFPKPLVPQELDSLADDDTWGPEESGVRTPESYGDFRSIREYQPGDPMKSIHWPATARSNELKVRQMDRPLPERYSVVFHSFCPTGTLFRPDNFEHALQVFAGLFTWFQNKGLAFEYTACFADWKTTVVETSADVNDANTLLARAEYRPQKNIKELASVLAEITAINRVLVLSDAPVEQWEPLLPAFPRPLLCLDGNRIRVHKPRQQFLFS